ncbi:hypothetical protein ACROYT_G029252 [Oculina patagonica]
MEGLANRVAPSHMLQAQQNIAGAAHYGAISLQQTQAEKMPPSYEEAQLAVQGVDLQQITNMEAEKQAIYRHPLLPLLAKLFEKCEQSTQTCECTSANSFDSEIKTGIIQMNREGKPFYTEDRELDNLMVKAIQVLRIHLLELEKVNELCKDFCQRYIACLKGKMQSENLLRSPLQTAYSPAVNVINSNVQQQQQQQPTTPIQAQQPAFMPQQQITYYAAPAVTPCTVANATPSASVIGSPIQQQVATVTYVPQGVAPGQQIVIAQVPQQPAVPTSVAYTNSSVPTTMAYTTVPANVTYVSTPTIETVTPPRLQTHSSGDESPTEITVPSSVPLPALDSPTEVTDKKRTRRGVLPKQATNIMKTWLFQHLVHPYPTEDEKRTIAAQTNLTILQVNNWFINARRRILQPMLDASNPEGPKAKKSKMQTRPAQRFWPDNLVPSQFNTIPIAPAPVTVQAAMMQGAVQMQAVPHGTTVTVPPGVALPTTITIPNVQGTAVIPGTVTLQQQAGTPTTMVVVTLPPSASQISTVSASDSSSTVTTHPSMIASSVSSQVETVSVSNLSPMYSNIQQGSPSLQNSPLPTMVQNGSMGGGERNLVSSPHHLPSSSVSIAGVQDSLVGVNTISLDSTAVSRGLVN